MGFLAAIPFFTPPPLLPDLLDPHQAIDLPPVAYMGVPLRGNSWVIVLYAVSLLANILGEELLWRGYLLPRQELVLGRWAWLANGLLWIIVFHAMFRWMWIALIPTGMITPCVAHRVKSTWASIIIHGFGNAIYLTLLLSSLFISP